MVLEFIACISTDYKKFRVGDIIPNPPALELLAVAKIVVVNLTACCRFLPKLPFWFHVNQIGRFPTYYAIVRVVALILKVGALALNSVI